MGRFERMNKKRFIACIAAVLLLLTAAGCGGTEEANRSAGGKTFVMGDTTFNPENNEPDINPHNDNSGWACIRYGVGETLFRYSDTMEIEPWLAESYEPVDDVTWRIVLRKNVTFTSGRPVDAQAVKECLEHLIAVHTRAAGDLHIASMEADGQVLTIRTTVPVPALPNYLSDPYGCIIDMQAGITSDGMVTATGPYKAVSLLSGDYVDLVKNDAYWNGDPKLDSITIRTISDGDTLTMALQSGEIDAAYGMPYASYPLFQNDEYTISSAATSRTFFVWMNFDSPLMQDEAVRKAISMAIDKQGFVDALLHGNGYPAAGPFPDTFVFGGDAAKAELYDLDGARRVLDDAGWKDEDGDGVREKNGRKLVLRWLTYPSRQELPLLAESAQATLKQIGVAVDIQCTADHNRVKKDRSAWDVYASAMVTAPSGDPQYFFTYCCLDGSDSNTGRYHSDVLEELARKMEGTFDSDKRGALAVQMAQTILDDHAYVFCSHLKMSMIARKGVTGLTAHPCDFYEITADLDKT